MKVFVLVVVCGIFGVNSDDLPACTPGQECTSIRGPTCECPAGQKCTTPQGVYDTGTCKKTATEEESNCTENEEFQECGTACPLTCDTLGIVLRCIKKCVVGCACKEGYVLDKPNGNCIAIADCPNDCKENEEYRKCKDTCPKTCDTMNDDTPCTRECKPGCSCKKGYVHDKKGGKCILKDTCPSEQGICNTSCTNHLQEAAGHRTVIPEPSSAAGIAHDICLIVGIGLFYHLVQSAM